MGRTPWSASHQHPPAPSIPPSAPGAPPGFLAWKTCGWRSAITSTFLGQGRPRRGCGRGLQEGCVPLWGRGWQLLGSPPLQPDSLSSDASGACSRPRVRVARAPRVSAAAPPAALKWLFPSAPASFLFPRCARCSPHCLARLYPPPPPRDVPPAPTPTTPHLQPRGTPAPPTPWYTPNSHTLYPSPPTPWRACTPLPPRQWCAHICYPRRVLWGLSVVEKQPLSPLGSLDAGSWEVSLGQVPAGASLWPKAWQGL